MRSANRSRLSRKLVMCYATLSVSGQALDPVNSDGFSYASVDRSAPPPTSNPIGGPALACEMRWILKTPSRTKINRALSSFDRPLSRSNKEASGR